MYRKSTHPEQYIHLSSITWWCTKVAWLRSLVYRAHKIFSSQELLREELHNIVKFVSWNDFPHWLTKKLTRSFTPTANPTNVNESLDKLPVIWIRLPFIGKTGTSSIREYTRKISRLLPQPAKFITLWDTTNTNTFLTLKDSTPIRTSKLDCL